jgi:HAD superfamily hydrolase (TIGR01549 family)
MTMTSVRDGRAGGSDPAETSGHVCSPAALILDLDDTLIDASRTRIEALAALDRQAAVLFETRPGAVVKHADVVLAEVWRDSPFVTEFKRLGCAATDALWVEFAGPGALLAEIRDWMPDFRIRFWRALCGRASARRQGDYAALSAAFVAERQARIRSFPGVIDALAELRRRFPLALLTNGPGDLQRLKLKHTGLQPYFDAIVVSAEAGVAKPRPEIFALTCDVIGVPSERTIMIGDDWDLDVMGARAAGLAAILVCTGSSAEQTTYQQARRGRVPMVNRLTDLPPFLLAARGREWVGLR